MSMRSLAFSTCCLLMLVGTTACSRLPEIKLGAEELAEKGGGPEVMGFNDSLEKMGSDAMQAGNYARAAEVYRSLIERTPDSVPYQLQFAYALRRSGEGLKSQAVYDRILLHDSGNLDALEGKGLSLMLEGEFGEAVKLFTQVLEEDATRWRTLNAIAVALASKDKLDEAKSYLQTALQVAPQESSIKNNIALINGLQGHYEEALSYQKDAYRDESPDINKKKQIALNLALIYALNDDMKKAEQVAAPHMSPSSIYNYLGFLAYISKDPEMAKSYLNMALTKSPVFYERAWKNLDRLEKTGSIYPK